VRIEGELAQREAALESLEAQAKALSDQTSLATVTVTLVGPTAPAAPKPVEATGFGTGLRQGWHAFTVGTTWLLTALGAVLPFAILFALVASGVWLVLRRRRTPAPLPEPPAPTAA